MQKPKAADYSNQQDYLNDWAGWQVNTGSWSEPEPTDWKAPVVTPQPDGMLTNTTTPTEDTYTAPPTDYVPEYVQPKTTQVEDLFSNELGSSTEADDPFAIDVESEDTYTAPPADYVPEYTAPVETATGYREDDDVSSSPDMNVDSNGVEYGAPDKNNQAIVSTEETRAAFQASLDAARKQFGDLPLDRLWMPAFFEASYDEDPARYEQYKADALAIAQMEQEAEFRKRLAAVGVSEEDMPDFSYRNPADDEQFNQFLSTMELENERKFYEAYDDIAEEYYDTLYNTLSTTDVMEFAEQYNELDTADKKLYLYEAFKNKSITEEQYRDNVGYLLAQDGKQVYKDPDTGDWKYWKKVGDNSYNSYRVNLLPEDYYQSFEIPSGETLYENQGAGLFVDNMGRELGYEGEALDKRKEMQFLEQGIGTRGEDVTKRLTTAEFFTNGIINSPLLDVLGVIFGQTGTLAAVRAATKVANGETLKSEDYASMAIAGLEAADLITAPTEIVDPVTGEVVKTAGQGLSIGGLNLSYDASKALINGLATEDFTAVVTSLMGDKWPDTLKGFGIPPTLVDDPDFMAAFNKGLNVALDGGNLEDVLTESVEKYIKEGGSFGVLPAGDYDFSMFDGLEDVLKPFMDLLKKVAGEAEDLLKPVVNVIADAADPIVNAADDILDATGDVIGDTVDVLADAADPIINTADDILDATGDVIGDTVDVVADTFEPVVDAADDIIDATGDTLEDLADALPDVPDVPDVPLPDVPLPDLNLNLPSMGMLSGTRTTDSLFGKDLFKFKTKIGVSPQEQLMQAPQRKQQKQEYDDLFEDPFASTFNFKV